MSLAACRDEATLMQLRGHRAPAKRSLRGRWRLQFGQTTRISPRRPVLKSALSETSGQASVSRSVEACHMPPLVHVSDEKTWRIPLNDSCDPKGERQGASVALGKFDAMHTGHRSLVQRATSLGGPTFLLSFWGMAGVLGWEDRLPVVAPQDRPRVLEGWAPWCGGCAPSQRYIPFASVRSMSAEEFVRFLARDLGATGVVAGRNFRFGYRAKGTVDDLLRLGEEEGMRVAIVDLVRRDGEATDETVSSSLVRDALSIGRMDTVAQLLGRRHRVVALARLRRRGEPAAWEGAPPRMGGGQGEVEHDSRDGVAGLPVSAISSVSLEAGQLVLPPSAFQNLKPGKGCYAARLTARRFGRSEGSWPLCSEGSGAEVGVEVDVVIEEDGLLTVQKGRVGLDSCFSEWAAGDVLEISLDF